MTDPTESKTTVAKTAPPPAPPPPYVAPLFHRYLGLEPIFTSSNAPKKRR
jgi:hypothetical protein